MNAFSDLHSIESHVCHGALHRNSISSLQVQRALQTKLIFEEDSNVCQESTESKKGNRTSKNLKRSEATFGVSERKGGSLEPLQLAGSSGVLFAAIRMEKQFFQKRFLRRATSGEKPAFCE